MNIIKNLYDKITERKEAYKKTWNKLKKSDRVIVVSLLSVGVVQLVVGTMLIWKSL